MTSTTQAPTGQEPRPTPDRASARRRRWIIGLLGGLVLAVIVTVIWLAGRPPAAPRESPAPNSMADMQGMQGVPGMAGMDMTGSGTVKLTAEQMGQFGVTFGSVEVRPLTAEVRTAGAIMVDETRVVQVAPRFGGFAERLYVDFTGQPVRRGQPLLEVYSPELVTAEEELLVASRLQREMGQSTVPGLPANAVDLLASAKRRLELWDISEEQIAEILRTGRVRRTLTLFAPAAGTVMEKRIVQGQAFATGEPLYTIANLETVWVEAQLREADATSVRFGSHAEMAIAGLPGRAFEGHVQFVYPTLDSVARAIRARIIVPNPDGLLKPGMYATVRLATPMRSALTVPTSAVLRTGERNLVFVDLGGGELRPQEVALGVVTGDYTEVLTGLEPGQRVVTSAQFLLDSESNLGEVMKAMLGQMPSGDARSMQDVPGMAAPGRR